MRELSSEEAAGMAAARERAVLACRECGGPFVGLRLVARFCSDRCRQRAWLRDHRERWNAARRESRKEPGR